MIFQNQLLVAGEARSRLFGGQDRFDLAVAQSDGVVFERRARGLYGNDPAGAD